MSDDDLVTGEKQDGRFKSGQSGNPAGRPKKTPEMREIEALAREYGPDAIARLADWMGADNARASVAACQAILDRGFGKPTQPNTHSGPEGGAIPLQMIELVAVKPNADTAD